MWRWRGLRKSRAWCSTSLRHSTCCDSWVSLAPRRSLKSPVLRGRSEMEFSPVIIAELLLGSSIIGVVSVHGRECVHRRNARSDLLGTQGATRFSCLDRKSDTRERLSSPQVSCAHYARRAF